MASHPDSSNSEVDWSKETKNVELILWLLLERQVITLKEMHFIKYYREDEDEYQNEHQRKCEKMYEILDKKLKSDPATNLTDLLDIFEETGNEHLSLILQQPHNAVDHPQNYPTSPEVPSNETELTQLRMADNDYLSLPASAINQIINKAIPAGCLVSSEAEKALSRAASIFILFSTTTASNNAVQEGRKAIYAADVFEAISQMEFEEEFSGPLRQALHDYQESMKEKMQEAAKPSSPSSEKAIKPKKKKAASSKPVISKVQKQMIDPDGSIVYIIDSD